jgi:hypothetical protein
MLPTSNSLSLYSLKRLGYLGEGTSLGLERRKIVCFAEAAGSELLAESGLICRMRVSPCYLYFFRVDFLEVRLFALVLLPAVDE